MSENFKSPSQPAMKAAEAVSDAFVEAQDRACLNAPTILMDELKLALIIDQETRCGEMEEACKQAILQIEYLHNKFKETGSGNNVITQLKHALGERG